MILITLFAGGLSVNAQNWNEWFRQRRTQIRYYVEQIAALQVYIELGQKGYGIYKDGLQVINDIKQGDFNLHNNYFGSLSAVKPSIRNSPTAKKIPVLRQLIISLCTQLPNKEYSKRVRNALLKNNNEQYEEFLLLTGNNNYALNDAERTARIDSIYQEMVNQYLFIKDFVYEHREMDYHLESELNDLRTLRRAVAGDATAHP